MALNGTMRSSGYIRNSGSDLFRQFFILCVLLPLVILLTIYLRCHSLAQETGMEEQTVRRTVYEDTNNKLVGKSSSTAVLKMLEQRDN